MNQEKKTACTLVYSLLVQQQHKQAERGGMGYVGKIQEIDGVLWYCS